MKLDKYEYKFSGQKREIKSQWEYGQWYKILGKGGSVFGVYYKAPNDCDTTHKVLKALQGMGFTEACGFQATDREFALKFPTKIHCFYNIYNEALDVTVYQFDGAGNELLSVFYDDKTGTWKIDRSCHDYTYRILKTKIKTHRGALEMFLTDVCEHGSAFNTWSLLKDKLLSA